MCTIVYLSLLWNVQLFYIGLIFVLLTSYCITNLLFIIQLIVSYDYCIPVAHIYCVLGPQSFCISSAPVQSKLTSFLLIPSDILFLPQQNYYILDYVSYTFCIVCSSSWCTNSHTWYIRHYTYTCRHSRQHRHTQNTHMQYHTYVRHHTAKGHCWNCWYFSETKWEW